MSGCLSYGLNNKNIAPKIYNYFGKFNTCDFVGLSYYVSEYNDIYVNTDMQIQTIQWN